MPLHTRRRRVGGAITAAAAAVLLIACPTNLASSTNTPSNLVVHIDTAGGSPAGHTTTTAAPTAAGGVGGDVGGGASSGQLRLVQEPQDNYRAIGDAISGASKTLDMTMYELADDTTETDLIAAHDRGVAIRIILDTAYHGGQVNADAYRQLTAAGIAVHWAPFGQIFHQKSLVIDDATVWIGSGNLTARYYRTSRDAWICDTNPTQVTAIAGTFNADWASPSHSRNAVGAPGLVWSPGAQQQIIADIAAAHTSVDFTLEELADTQVIAALAAAKRGVICRIVMTDSRSWTGGFTQVTTSGCAVHVFPVTAEGLFIHEKLIVVDGAEVLIGSQNASSASLNRNRELSIQITAAPIAAAAEKTFTGDYTAAPAWKKPGA